jgi:NADPH:quinone reductase-like Zn-dependent oxidoreductase
MKAVQIKEYGDATHIAVAEANQPEPKAGEVLVKVKAASLNALDTKLHMGAFQKMVPLALPTTIGTDFSGIVEAVGADVTTLKPGDKVSGMSVVLAGGSGALAEYSVTTADNVALKPASSSHEEAASLVVTGTTAVRVAEEFMNPQDGQTVLVVGGAGGVGSIVLQYVHALGIRVDATVQGEQAVNFAHTLGAAKAYDAAGVGGEQPASYDIVLDTAGGDAYKAAFTYVKPGGTLVTMSEMPDETLAKQYDVHVISVAQQKPRTTTAQNLEHLAELVAKDSIRPHIAKVFPFAEAQEAFAYFENAHPLGKVIVAGM